MQHHSFQFVTICENHRTPDDKESRDLFEEKPNECYAMVPPQYLFTCLVCVTHYIKSFGLPHTYIIKYSYTSAWYSMHNMLICIYTCNFIMRNTKMLPMLND